MAITLLNQNKNSSNNSTKFKGKVSQLSEGLNINGNIYADSSIRIDGNFYGNIIVNNKLVIGNNGYVKGCVIAEELIIEGKIEGDIVVKQIMDVLPNAKIKGNIFTKKLRVEPGAEINGKCFMGENIINNLKISPEPKWENFAKQRISLLSVDIPKS